MSSIERASPQMQGLSIWERMVSSADAARRKVHSFCFSLLDKSIGMVQLRILSTLSGGELKDKTLQARVQIMVDELSLHTHRANHRVKYQVTLINSKKATATCLSGNRIVVFKGLIDVIDALDLSQDEEVTKNDVLAAVIGHEVAHVALGHSIVSITFPFLSIAVVPFWLILTKVECPNQMCDPYPISTSVPPPYVWMAILFFQLLSLAHRRNNEREADKYGIELMYKAKYNVRGSLPLLKRPNIQSPFNRLIEVVDTWISTHPSPRERLNLNRKTIVALEARAK